MEEDFYYNNLSFCSLNLFWKDQNNENDNSYEYELYQQEKEEILIYEGKKTKYRTINLEPKKEYTFILRILKNGKKIDEKVQKIKTLNSPVAILAKNSLKLENNNIINNENELSKDKKEIISNCSKIIFDKKDEDILKGDFDGIEIKIAYEVETNIHYISFDIKSEYFSEFFKNFLEECKNGIITPCHFIIQKLPTILIFHLLDKGPIILTGKRMGGVIASSLAFYILSIGKKMKKDYNNTFLKKEKKSIGVVTFGSPSFLINLSAGDLSKNFVSYFYNIKDEFDYIPGIIDFFNKEKEKDYKYLLNIFEKLEMDDNDKATLHKLLKEINFIKKFYKNEDNIKKLKKIPFGYYYSINSSNSYKYINDEDFINFYYLKYFDNKDSISNLNIYEKLSSKIVFDKKSLEFFEKKNEQLEYIKIIRRNIEPNSMKGIIKFKLKLIEHNDNIIPPDIIHKIILKSNNETYEINNKNIYYDNDIDITAFIDNLNENIKEVIIINNFGGELKIKNIINIQGSGQTREMLKNCIEKIFLFPYFKLIEIFYSSLNDTDGFNKINYENLKIKNLGKDFDNSEILKPFDKQIKTLDKLLILTRPDILGKNENWFIKEYLGVNMDDERKKCLENKFHKYYEQAIHIQTEENINCIDSEKNSFAKKYSFPQEIKEAKGIKKLFMFDHDNFKNNNFILQEIDDTFVKEFFIKQLLKDSLQKIECDILKNITNKKQNEIKNYLNDSINKYYKKEIMPNIDFIYILILSSIESGDEIKFNHNIDWKNFSLTNISLSFLIIYFLNTKGMTFFEKDFVKSYKADQIEAFHMKNLFDKTKSKNILRSNISENFDNIIIEHGSFLKYFNFIIPFFIFNFKHIISSKDNKSYIFSEYSEKQIFGKEYYEKFLELLNKGSNDFQEDIEISIYDNLKEDNKNKEKNYSTIKDMIKELIDDEESKKGFLALLRQSYLLGELRSNIVSIYINNFYLQEDEYIIGVFGKKKVGKSTFINKIFRECETNNSFANSTIGLNLYNIKNISNFAIIDSPGDTEIDKNLQDFTLKGYKYTKMFVYIISEENILDSDSLNNNKKLEEILKFRAKYKIPLIILLTHFDDYCNKVKNSEQTNNNWKIVCKEHINNNTNNLIKYLIEKNEEIKEKEIDFREEENRIIHVVLAETNQNSDQEIINKLSEDLREIYINANEEMRKKLLLFNRNGIESTANEIKNFMKNEKVLGQKELIEKMKEDLPSQFHKALK